MTDEAYFFRTFLISSVLIFSISSTLIDSRLKISMVTAIGEKSSELGEKRGLDGMSFLIDGY
jgi:hypothetical protein